MGGRANIMQRKGAVKSNVGKQVDEVNQDLCDKTDNYRNNYRKHGDLEKALFIAGQFFWFDVRGCQRGI